MRIQERDQNFRQQGPTLASEIGGAVVGSLQTSAALAAGSWILKRFPKVALIGLVGAGAYLLYNMSKKNERPTGPLH
jgi:hypothetical protein